MIRVLAVDDHPPILWAVRRALRRIPAEVDGVASLAEARERVGEGFDLVLLDLHFRTTLDTGFHLLAELRTSRPGLPVVILSAFDDRHLQDQARRNGAKGFISKLEIMDTWDEAVRVVLSGDTWFRPVDSADTRSRLTPRQVEVAGLLAGGLNEREIALELRLSGSMVEKHVYAARRATGASSTAQLAAEFVARGFHLVPRAPAAGGG